MTLLPALRQFMPPNPRTGDPGGIVFNLAHGIQGDARYTHVPSMLEMAGIAYVGPTPLGLAQALDKVAAKALMQHAGVPTPASPSEQVKRKATCMPRAMYRCATESTIDQSKRPFSGSR